ncbi:hypothetical protein ElyMa_000866100 [Elysia marginata]|uniref:Uncharacterized protein n=1 Tax=Elysia marginata TaxID=1093978 RepID=A0AAV4H5M8_9GAST|nr:hypothetical protein ElyMa_000866100 [Elysia marginata]
MGADNPRNKTTTPEAELAAEEGKVGRGGGGARRRRRGGRCSLVLVPLLSCSEDDDGDVATGVMIFPCRSVSPRAAVYKQCVSDRK